MSSTDLTALSQALITLGCNNMTKKAMKASTKLGTHLESSIPRQNLSIQWYLLKFRHIFCGLKHHRKTIAKATVSNDRDAPAHTNVHFSIFFITSESGLVSWLSRGPDSSGEVWIGCKRLILKLSEVLSVQGVKGTYVS